MTKSVISTEKLNTHFMTTTVLFKSIRYALGTQAYVTMTISQDNGLEFNLRNAPCIYLCNISLDQFSIHFSSRNVKCVYR